MSKNDNPSPSSYEISRFGDRSRQKVPTASFASTTQRFRCKQVQGLILGLKLTFFVGQNYRPSKRPITRRLESMSISRILLRRVLTPKPIPLF